MPREDPVRAARLHRALRIAAQAGALQTERLRISPAHKPTSHGAAFRNVLVESRNGTVGDARATLPEPPGQKPFIRESVEQILRNARARATSARAAGTATWHVLGRRLAMRSDRALARAAALASRTRHAGLAAWQASIATLDNGVDRVWRHGRPIGNKARRATADWPVITGAVAIVLVVSVWLVQLHPTPPAQIADAPEKKTPPAAAPVVAAPSHTASPHDVQATEPRPAPEHAAAAPAEPAKLPLASSPKLKPGPRGPALAARLKPLVKDASDAAASPRTAPKPQPQFAVPAETGPPRRQPQ
jgi:hypothetical protein